LIDFMMPMGKRTTLTLEDDVAERIDAEARRTGRSVKAVVNDALRTGLADRQGRDREPFAVKARHMDLRRNVDLDDVAGLLERLDGIERR
jgi:predicted transcriptional regulator